MTPNGMRSSMLPCGEQVAERVEAHATRDATLPEAAEDFVTAVRERCDELTELLKLPPYGATGAIEE